MRYTFNNNISSEELYLYSGGYDPTKPNHTYGPTIRSGYMLHYVYQGKGILTSNNIDYPLATGDFFFIEPNRIIKYQAHQEDPWAFYWIGFKGTVAAEYLKRCQLSSENPVFHNTSGLRIKELLGEIIEISLIQADNDILLNAKLLEILYQLVAHFPKQKPVKKQSSNQLLSEAMQFIQNNFERETQIQEIADSLSIDRTYLHRIFQQELGMGPKEYLTTVRIRQAQKLLAESELPINIVAFSVGYENSQQFSRIFKQKTGHSPKAYRQVSGKR